MVSACADSVVRARESQEDADPNDDGPRGPSADRLPRFGPATRGEWLRKKSARYNKRLHSRQQLQLLKKVHLVFHGSKILQKKKLGDGGDKKKDLVGCFYGP